MTNNKILYVSAFIPGEVFGSIFGYKANTPGLAVQKYHRVMVEGLTSHENCDVTCISGLPVSKSNYKGLITPKFPSPLTSSEGTFVIPRVINFPLIKNICASIAIKNACTAEIKKAQKENQNVNIITDLLSVSAARGAIKAGKAKNVHVTGIVTDLPEHLSGLRKGYEEAFYKNLQKCDSYVFLTEDMNKKLNPHKKPYVIIEGQTSEKDAQNMSNGNAEIKPQILYAGSLEKIYGIEKLTKAFTTAKKSGKLNSDIKLVIYGNGEYRDTLEKLTKDKESGIEFRGVADNKTVVDAEKESLLLVNPRPKDGEFTKYSFPSKNMEYMLSGRPLLSTCLPGMPDEYKKYLLLFENETTEKMAETISKAVNLTESELSSIGQKAKMFVIANKNCKVQTGKILEMIL